ncbi:hypothetical protein BVX94_02355 [bacterium B17]|nr:hypothetical protein BVX94_02355 [bacterium B17]
MPDSRDIFGMRREGNSQGALDLARELYAEDQNDLWLIRAYGWSLHDCLKIARDNNNTALLTQLAEEFAKLNIPDDEDDELLLNAKNNWQQYLPTNNGGPAVATLLDQGRQASQNNNRQEALRIFRNVVEQAPDNNQAATSLAWEITRGLKDLLQADNVDADAIQGLLREYARLENIDKPSNLHSLVLRRAAKAAQKESFPGFIRFLQWWDTANLMPGDYERIIDNRDADKSYDSCVELIIKGLHKAADHEQDSDTIRWASAFMAQHYNEYPNQEWFEYYYGKMLVRTGDLEHARNLIMPIVRKKKREFWAWDNLAATYTDSDGNKRLSCLCKALTCKVPKEAFLMNVRVELGELLAELGQHPEARFEIDKVINIRSSNEWKIPQQLQDIQASDWYEQASPPDSNKDLYKEYSPNADALIYEDLPELPGIVVHSLKPREGKAGVTFVGYLSEGVYHEAGTKTKDHNCLKSIKHGAPVSIQIDDSSDRTFVLAVKHRDADPWDILPPHTGIIKHVNYDKGITNVVLGRDDFCLLHHDKFADIKTEQPGTAVQVKITKDEKRGILRAHAWQLTTELPDESFCKEYSGVLEVHESGRFAFIDHDVFIAGKHIEGHALSTGDEVQGKALLELNKKKNQYGWSAITIEKI